jgi:hypothetical protein
METVEVIISMCTMLKGVPHGFAFIECTDHDDKRLQFKGIGIFNHGKLESGPFVCIDGEGWGYSFTKMQNGRPEDNSYST